MVDITDDDFNAAQPKGLVDAGDYDAVCLRVYHDPNVDESKFKLTWHEDGTGRFLCYDTLTFAGKAIGIAIGKAMRMGVVTKDPATRVGLNPDSFKGARTRLRLYHKLSTSNGRTYANTADPDNGGNDDDFFFGYAEAKPRGELHISHPDAQPPAEPAHPGEVPF